MPSPIAPATPNLTQIVEELAADRRLGPEVVFREHLPGRAARHGELSAPLAEGIGRALSRSGVERLWSHQAEALELARAGENVLVTTPTASGKSLVFQLPVLEEAARGGPGRALFLFPLKALGQDQLAKLDELSKAAGLEVSSAIYDGDTPQSRRRKIRGDPPRVLVTNPDMLHYGIVPWSSSWGPFLGELKWIVLDELHTYRGIFGSHFHHVLQRFLRLARAEGAEPRLIASSATAAGADAFAQSLTGEPFHWIHETGAPREGRHLMLLRPESSPYTTALRLFVALLQAGLKTIVFTKARRITELLYSWLRRGEPELARRVASYRSGFLPEERRKIERRLFDGELAGVISTSALEMGIDVGGLDACVLVGYPGSVMATWQRSGRVGRAGRESLTALVALPDALDQYLLEHPRELIERPCERLIVDPANASVSRAHLLCAAAERPLDREVDRAYLEPQAPVVETLLAEGELLESADGRELLTRRRRPQREVTLRGSGRPHEVVDEARGRVIGTLDGVRVLHEGHPGAIYLHAGRTYKIESLDLEARRVHAREARVDYFTTPLTEKETVVLEVLGERRSGPLQAWLARVEVTERVVGYERKRMQGQEVLGREILDLPPTEFETVGLLWAAPRAVERELARRGEHFLGALHASEHTAISLFPLLALCDRNDIGGISYPYHPQLGCGAVFIYDGHPGGVGLARRGFAELDDLLARVVALLEECPCEDGCPSCVQSPKCGNGNRPLDKAGAASSLRLLLGRDELAEEVPRLELRAAEELDGSETWPARRHQRESAALPSEAKPEPAPESEKRVPASSSPQSRPSAPPELPRAPKTTALFDLETLRSAQEVGGWGQSHRMGVAVGVVCLLEEGRFEVFREDRVAELVAMLEAADLVVGFNVKRFDYRVLSGYTGIDYERRWPTLDLLEDIHRRLGFRLGLDHLASATLGAGKTADGLQSLEWVRAGRFDLVEDYCRHDVEILRDLYLFGRREGHVCYLDRRKRTQLKCPVDW